MGARRPSSNLGILTAVRAMRDSMPVPYDTASNTEYCRRWRRTAVEVLVKALGGSCRACGYDRCVGALDFHHVDASAKKDQIGDLVAQRSWRRLRAEVTKCVLLCCRCHREVHHGLRVSPKPTAYVLPERLSYGPRAGDRRKKACPVSTIELRELRKRMSYDALASHLRVNKRTAMRWCKEMLFSSMVAVA